MVSGLHFPALLAAIPGFKLNGFQFQEERMRRKKGNGVPIVSQNEKTFIAFWDILYTL